MKAWLLVLTALPACWAWQMPFFGGTPDPDKVKEKLQKDLKVVEKDVDDWRAAKEETKKKLQENARQKGNDIASHTEEIKKGIEDVKDDIEKANTSEMEISEATRVLKKYGKDMEEIVENPSRVKKRKSSQSEEESKNPFASILSPDYTTNEEDEEEKEKEEMEDKDEEEKGIFARMKGKLRRNKEKRAERKRRQKEGKEERKKKGFLRRFLSKKKSEES